jgi:hypothetical protein
MAPDLTMRPPSVLTAAVLLLLAMTLFAADVPPRHAGFVLAGAPVTFDAELRPRFTKVQLSSAAKVTLQGFDRWARTEEGRSIIRRVSASDRTVIIEEDPDQPSLGRAPQPVFTILLAARNPAVHKQYAIVLNPSLAAQFDNGTAAEGEGPRSAADAMALAWAAEMLHIDFYADGVALPHHERADFQERWRAVTRQLGFLNASHGNDD